MEKFRDLSRNERTYLAWVRTAVGFLIFGFLMRKTEQLLEIMAASAKVQMSLKAATVIEIVGAGLMVIAVLIIIAATARFIIQKIRILQDKEVKHASFVMSKILALFLVVAVVCLVIYLLVLILPPI